MGKFLVYKFILLGCFLVYLIYSPKLEELNSRIDRLETMFNIDEDD
jgi:hypothetical protein